LTDGELKAVHEVIVRVKNGLKKTFGAQGFNIAWNEGALAGQSVPHLHIHVVPRIEGDAGIYEYEPRKFLYRPGSRNESPEGELEEVAGLIRSNMAQV
jgi:diadenosine tetraphosphate (Ap4A) HIT family hydrolase